MKAPVFGDPLGASAYRTPFWTLFVPPDHVIVGLATKRRQHLYERRPKCVKALCLPAKEATGAVVEIIAQLENIYASI